MKQKKITFFIAIFSFIILNTLIAFNIYKTKFISKDIVRLHVIANSNSIADQITKLKVESNLNEYISSLNSKNKKDLIEDITKSKDKILNIANTTIKQSNNTYSSSLKIGKINYDEKQNMLVDMSSGTYDSTCIILGEGNGKNIWSMIFPNEKTIDKIKELDTIFPGISQLYKSSPQTKEIKSKLFPTFGLTL